MSVSAKGKLQEPSAMVSWLNCLILLGISGSRAIRLFLPWSSCLITSRAWGQLSFTIYIKKNLRISAINGANYATQLRDNISDKHVENCWCCCIFNMYTNPVYLRGIKLCWCHSKMLLNERMQSAEPCTILFNR